MIGIIGGIGPAAGADLVQKVIEGDDGKLDDARAPVILYSDANAIPSRNDYLLGRSNHNPADDIVRVIEKLLPLDVNLIAIACNAAHSEPIFSEIIRQTNEKKLPVQILHLIELFADKILNELPYRHIGVMSVAGTYHAGAYTIPFNNRRIEILKLPEDYVNLMHEVIWSKGYGVKAFSNPTQPEALEKAHLIMDHYVDHGADAIVLGCTEYPLLLNESLYRDIPILDANRYFAAIIIEEYEKIKTVP